MSRGPMAAGALNSIATESRSPREHGARDRYASFPSPFTDPVRRVIHRDEWKLGGRYERDLRNDTPGRDHCRIALASCVCLLAAPLRAVFVGWIAIDGVNVIERRG